MSIEPEKLLELKRVIQEETPGAEVTIATRAGDLIVGLRDGDLNDLPVTEAQVRTALSWAGCIAGALTIKEMASVLVGAGFEAVAIAPPRQLPGWPPDWP